MPKSLNSFRFSLIGALTCLLAACGPAADTNTSSLGTTPGGGNTATPKKVGSVVLSSTETSMMGATLSTGNAVANFSKDVVSAATASGCKTSTVETCTVSTCEFAGTGTTPTTGSGTGTGSGTATPDTASAGTINIKGTASPITLRFVDGIYAPFSSSSKLWKDGETINVEASGDQVPAFKLSAKAPAVVTLSEPSVTSGSLSIKAGQAVNLAWTNGGAGDVQISLNTASSKSSRSVVCKFSASAGKGTIPAQATSQLLTDGTSASYSLLTSSTATTSVADYNITLVLNGTGTGAAGMLRVSK